MQDHLWYTPFKQGIVAFVTVIKGKILEADPQLGDGSSGLAITYYFNALAS